MNKSEKIQKCKDFFYTLRECLKENYRVMGSCNRDLSAYLVPKGAEGQVTYYGKPERSFRISDHWNWYSNLKKCREEDNIQCYCVSLPAPNERIAPAKASESVRAVCVAFYYQKAYHTVYGDVYDAEKECWKWVEPDPEEVAALLGKSQFGSICEIAEQG